MADQPRDASTGQYIAKAQVGLGLDQKPFDIGMAGVFRGLKKFAASPVSVPLRIKDEITKNLGGIANGIRSALGGGRGIYGALSTAAAVAGVSVAIHKAVKGASDLDESMQKVGVVFGASTSIVTRGADDMAKKFGIVRQEFIDSASSIGLITKASGLSQEAAAGLSDKLTRLAIDASSFYNTSLQDALIAMRAGLVGESEPLRRFGVLLNEAAVDNEALALGLAKSKKGLTDGIKVQARASLIVKGLADATGDLERTSGSFANQSRAISGRFANMLTTFGQKIIPIFSQIQELMGKALSKLGDYLEENGAYIAAWSRGVASKLSLLTQLWHNWGKFAQIAGLLVKEKLLQIAEIIRRVGATAWEYLKYGAESAVTFLKNLFTGFATFLSDLFSSLGANLAAHLQNAIADMMAGKMGPAILAGMNNIPGLAPFAGLAAGMGAAGKVPVPGIKANMAGLGGQALVAGMPAAPGTPGGGKGFGGLLDNLPHLGAEIGKLVDHLHGLNAADAIKGMLDRTKEAVKAMPKRALTPIEQLNRQNRALGNNRPEIRNDPRDRLGQRNAARVLEMRRQEAARNARQPGRSIASTIGDAAAALAKRMGGGDIANRVAGAAGIAAALGAVGLGIGVTDGRVSKNEQSRRAMRARYRAGRGGMPGMGQDLQVSGYKPDYLDFGELGKNVQSNIQSASEKPTKSEGLLQTIASGIGDPIQGGSVTGLLGRIAERKPGPGFAVA